MTLALALIGGLFVQQVASAPQAEARSTSAGGTGSTVTGGGIGQSITDTQFNGAKLSISAPQLLLSGFTGTLTPQTGRTNPNNGAGFSTFQPSWGAVSGSPTGAVFAQPTAWNRTLPYAAAGAGYPLLPDTMINDNVHHDVMQFTVSFDPPVVDPVLNATTFGWAVTDGTSKSKPFGQLKVTGATSASGTAAVTMSKLSGFTQDGIQWNLDASGKTLTSAVDTSQSQPLDVSTYTGGTLKFASNGQAISSITFVSADSWAVSGTDRAFQPSNWGFQLSAPEAVSALGRWIGGYPAASHLMPLNGTSNLHLGASIAEGAKTYATTAADNGTAADNSDAGYDGLGAIYFADDAAKTPVTTIYPSDAGRRLETQVKVAGSANQTAYVAGFIDFNRDRQFAGAELSGAEMVPGGNGTATLQWTIPNNVSAGDLPIRLRVAYDQAQAAAPAGGATSGEVEDYQNKLSGSTAGSRNNLKIAKTVVSGADVQPGGTVTYQLWLSNTSGVASTSAVTVSDDLPTQLENATVSMAPTTGTASITGNKLTWQIPAGVTADSGMQVTGTVKTDAATGTMSNTATLSGLCDAANCTSTATSTISGKPASLSVVQTGPASVQPGGTVQYKLVLTNNGERPTATSTVVTTTLPSQIVTSSVTSNATVGSANLAGSSLSWRVPAGLPAGGTAELTVNARASASAAVGSSITSTAQITQGECTGGACSSPVTSQVVKSDGALSIEQTAPSSDVFPNTDQTYTYKVTNNGSVPLTNVTVTDGTYIFAGDSIRCEGTGNDVIPTLAAGASVTCTLNHHYTINEFKTGRQAWYLDGLTNYGRVSATDPAGSTISADGQSTTHFDITTDMKFKKTVESITPEPVRPGSVVAYRLDLSWTGEDGLWAVSFADSRIPASQWNCTPPVTETIGATFTSVCRATYQITEKDIRDNWTSGEIINRAAFTGSSSIWPFMNITTLANATVNVDKSVPKVELTGSLTADKTDAEPGDTVTFTAKVKNSGQLTATDVVVLDTFKGGPETAIPAANCTWPGTPGTLAPGAEVTCTTPYVVQESDVNTTITDKARARAMDGTEPVGPVDIGEVQVKVGSGIMMSATKANDLGPGAKVKPGQQFGYTITLKNDGTAAATNQTVTDQLPDGLEFFPTSQPGWTFTGNRAVSDPVTVPKGGGTVDLTFTVRVKSDTAGGTQVKNVAAIDGMATPAECAATPTKVGCAVDPYPPTVDDSKILLTKTNSITKVPPTVRIGETFTYTIKATNSGKSDASSVVITDQLPDGLAFDPTSQSLWTFAGNTATSASLNIAGGATVTLTVSVKVLPTATGELVNVSAVNGMATIDECAADPTRAGCGVDQNPPTVVDHSGITLAKSNDVTSVGKKVKVGESFTYTITATNSTGRIAENVLISDTLPTGLVFDGPQNGWTIRSNTASIEIDVPANGEESVSLKVRVAPGATGTLLNTAVMDDTDPATCATTPTPAGCGVDPEPPVVDNTNMSITKSNSVTTGRVRPGDSYTYTFAVHNAGSETAVGVVIADELQAELEFDPATQPDFSASGQQVTSSPFDVTAGTTVTKTFTVRVKDDAKGETVLRNTGLIDPMVTPSDCAAQPTRQGCAADPRPPVVDDSNITIEKSNYLPGTPPLVEAGDSIRYGITVKNIGSSPASGVKVSDLLPAGLEYYPTPQSGWTITGQTATTSFGLVLEGGEQQTFYLTARVTPTAKGSLVNVAAISGKTPVAQCAVDATLPGCAADPNPPEVVDHSGVKVEKENTVTAAGKLVKVGDVFSYNLTVTNGGATPAKQVVVSDTLPSGLVFNGPQNSVWQITGSTAKTTVDLDPGEVATYELTVRVAPGAKGTLRNVSVLDSQDPAQCTDTTANPACGVDPEPPVVDNTDVSIKKANSVGAGAKVKPGQQFSYTFAVTNSGSEPASGIVIKDTLPDGLEFASLTQAGWQLSGTSATSDPLTLTAGETRNVTLDVRVKTDASGGTVIKNIGVIEGKATPEDCATTPTKVGCAVDPYPPTVDDSNITITKVNDVPGTPKIVKAGDRFTYTLTVKNTGKSTASGVRVNDQLPDGLVFAPSAQSMWTLTGTTARSAAFVLDGGEQVTLFLSVEVASNAKGTLLNVSAIENVSTPAQCAAEPTRSGCGVDPEPPAVADHSAVAITKVNDVTTTGKVVKIGDTFTYTIKATNSATTPAYLVDITDTLPAGLVLDGTQNSIWTVTGDNKVSARVTVPGPGSVEYDVNVKVAPGARGTLTNIAVLDDRTPAECQADATLHGCGVDPQPPTVAAPMVTITKTNSVGANATVKLGQTYSYTITAKNDGGYTAENIRLTDTLPADLEFSSLTQSGWTISGKTAQSDSFTLAPGASRQFTLRVMVSFDAESGAVLNNAVVQDGGPGQAECFATPTLAGCGVDPNPPTVDAEVITISKTSNVDFGSVVEIGQQVTYLITVRNVGVVDETNIKIADLLPDGLVFDPIPQSGWTIDGRRATLTDSFSLAVGAQRQFTLLTRAQKAVMPSRNVAVITQYDFVAPLMAGTSSLKSLKASPTPTTIPGREGPTLYECQKDATQQGCAYADVTIVAPTANPSQPEASPTPSQSVAPTAQPTASTAAAPKTSVLTQIVQSLSRLFRR